MEKENLEKKEVEVVVEKKVEEKPVAEATKKKKTKKMNPFFMKGSLIGVFVVIILFIITFGIGIYQYQWDNSLTKNVVKVVPYPVLMVDGSFVSYKEFLDDVEALTKFSKMQASLGGQQAFTSGEQLKQVVMKQFISREIIKNSLDEYDIKLTYEEIDEEYKKVLTQQGGEEEALIAQLDEVYGWTLDQFKEKIIRFGLMEGKLAKEISKDDDLDLNKEAKEKAQKLLDRIKGGESYVEIAKGQENEDIASAKQEGDLGFVSKGMLVKEFEDAAFAMKPGEVSELVKTAFGYHIIKFEERKEATDDAPEQIRVRNILVKSATLNDYLNHEEDEATIWKFVNTSEWPEL